VDDRRVISGILHILKTGCRWRDVPPAYGPPTTVYNRYNRWSKRSIWQRIFAKMAASGVVPEELSIDTSHIKAHRSAAGAKRGSMRKRLGARAAEERAKSMLWPMIVADRSPSP
jgi:transposase